MKIEFKRNVSELKFKSELRPFLLRIHLNSVIIAVGLVTDDATFQNSYQKSDIRFKN